MSEGRLPNTLMLGVSSVEATATEMGQSTTKFCLWCPLSGTRLTRVRLQAPRWRLYMILDFLSKCAPWMWLLLHTPSAGTQKTNVGCQQCSRQRDGRPQARFTD